MSPQRRLFLIGSLACAVVIGVTLALVLLLVDEAGVRLRPHPSVDGPKPSTVDAQGFPAVDSSVPRRVPVAGAEGYAIVINPDGSSYLEGPGGLRRQLAGPMAGDGQTLADDILKRLDKRPSKVQGLGQLIVCDRGAVNVPVDVVITFVGPDRVVAVNPKDSSATVYYTDGRVERRDRVADRPRGEAKMVPAVNSKD